MMNLINSTLLDPFLQTSSYVLSTVGTSLDMEAVIWLEDYLSKWDKILLLISHSQDFLNNVCTHMLHFTNNKSLVYYDGNYDQFMKTKSELYISTSISECFVSYEIFPFNSIPLKVIVYFPLKRSQCVAEP